MNKTHKVVQARTRPCASAPRARQGLVGASARAHPPGELRGELRGVGGRRAPALAFKADTRVERLAALRGRPPELLGEVGHLRPEGAHVVPG